MNNQLTLAKNELQTVANTWNKELVILEAEEGASTPNINLLWFRCDEVKGCMVLHINDTLSSIKHEAKEAIKMTLESYVKPW